MTYYAHPSAIIDAGASIGSDTKIWHFSHIMAGAVIGESCTLGQNVFIGANVILGNYVKVQNNVSLYTGVVCEDYVFIGPSVVFTNVINPRSVVDRKKEIRQTKVMRGATIGANATVICGNCIGMHAFIGAGAVVTKNVLSYALVLGNPGIQKGWISEMGHLLKFDSNQRATCPESEATYILNNNSVSKIIP